MISFPSHRRVGGRQRPSAAQHDLGVLFVHGIGNQTLGSTLTDFGTPLVEWLRGRAEQVQATVTANTTTLSTSAGEPATSEIVVKSAAQTRRWLLAESWWAQSFPVAQFRHVGTWSLLVVPWTLGTHLAKGWARAQGPNAVRLRIAALLVLAGALALSPVLLLILIILLGLGRIPWPQLQAAVARVHLAISSSLGDSYMLVARPLEAAAIRTQVGRDLESMLSRCRRVAVIAHSQGGAIACQVMRARPSPPPDTTLLITFGSGLRKLAELEDVHERGGMLEGALVSVAGLFVTAVMMLFAPLVVYQATEGAASAGSVITLVVFAAFGLVIGIAGIQDFIRAREPQRLRTMASLLAFKGIAWDDVYASADPVPNGRLHDDENVSPPASTGVVNLGSMLHDHTTYWDNRDEFVAMVAERLLGFDRPGILAPEDPAVLAFFRAHRSIRIRVLQALRWTTTLSVLPLLWTYRAEWLRVSAWTSYRVLAWAGGLVGYVPAAVSTPAAPVWSRSVGWLAAVLAAGWMTRFWWTLWNRAAMRDAQSGICRARQPLLFVLSVLLQVALAGTAVLPAQYAFGAATLATLALVIAIVVAQSKHPIPASRQSAPSPDVPSSAVGAARALLNLLLAAMTMIGGPAAFIAGARWTQALLAPRAGVVASWIAAVAVIVFGAIVSIVAWRELVKSWSRNE